MSKNDFSICNHNEQFHGLLFKGTNRESTLIFVMNIAGEDLHKISSVSWEKL